MQSINDYPIITEHHQSNPIYVDPGSSNLYVSAGLMVDRTTVYTILINNLQFNFSLVLLVVIVYCLSITVYLMTCKDCRLRYFTQK